MEEIIINQSNCGCGEDCTCNECESQKYSGVHEILRKDGKGKVPVYPLTYIQAVFDKRTGVGLETILAQFNNVFLQYQGTPYATRNFLPVEMRRKGIIISYKDMKSEIITEKCVNDTRKDDNHWGLDSNWVRIDELSLSGDISVSVNGTWVINGEDTGIKALGPKGDNGLTPWLKTINNKLYHSYDNENWELSSDYIAAWFRFSATSSDGQAGTIGKIQISRDQKTWTDLSLEFANSLRISEYVSDTESLPSNSAHGTIYGVGPTYNEADTGHTNPIYRIYVKGSTGWVDNGSFTSIAAGVVQELGESETEVMSQKAVSENVSLLRESFDDVRLKLYEDGISTEATIQSSHVFVWLVKGYFPEGTIFESSVSNIGDILERYGTVYRNMDGTIGYAYDFYTSEKTSFQYNKDVSEVGIFINQDAILAQGTVRITFEIPSKSTYLKVIKNENLIGTIKNDYLNNIDEYVYIEPESVIYGSVSTSTGNVYYSDNKLSVFTPFYKVPDNLILRPFENSDKYKYYCAIFCYDGDKNYIGVINSGAYRRFGTMQKLLDGTKYIRFTITCDDASGQTNFSLNSYILGFPIGDGINNRNITYLNNKDSVLNATFLIKDILDRLSSTVKTYQNPLYDEGNFPDPAIWSGEDGYYYCIGTNGISNFPVIRSSDLINWEYYGNNLITPYAIQLIHENNPDISIFYSPHMRKIGNHWNLYISISYQKMIVLTSKYPDRGFTFVDGYKELVSNDITGLDATYEDGYCYVDNGIPYLFWGSAGKLYAVRLTEDGYNLYDNNFIRVISGISRGALHEGTYILKRDGYYYYFGSGGFYQDYTYKITVGRSESLLGPYYDNEGNIIDGTHAKIVISSEKYDMFYGVGHNGEIFTDSLGKTYMFLHTYDFRKTYGVRYLSLQEIKWDSKGWPYVDGGKLRYDGVSPKLPIQFL